MGIGPRPRGVVEEDGRRWAWPVVPAWVTATTSTNGTRTPVRGPSTYTLRRLKVRARRRGQQQRVAHVLGTSVMRMSVLPPPALPGSGRRSAPARRPLSPVPPSSRGPSLAQKPGGRDRGHGGACAMVGPPSDRRGVRTTGRRQPARDRTRLGPGDKAPAFTLPDQDGTKVSLRDFAGKPVVVYFYPADDTPGCTKEACQFNDNLRAFSRAGCGRPRASPPTGPTTHRALPEEVRAAVPAAHRRRPRRDGALRRLGREDAVRQEVGGGDPLHVPGGRRRQGRSGPGTTCRPTAMPPRCWPSSGD